VNAPASGSRAPELAVSTVIFTLRPDASGDMRLALPLVRRIRAPHQGSWALPGAPLKTNEDLQAAAASALLSTTGLEPRYLEQLYAFGQVDRSPDRVVSIVYWALVGSDETAAAIESENVQWFFTDEVPALAFDHNTIIEYALWRLRSKIEYSRVALGFLGETFTLAQLREVYEVVLGKKLDPGNFRRMVESADIVEPTGERLEGTRHRPPQLYRYNASKDLTDPDPLTLRNTSTRPNARDLGAAS
jgi:8-oxo-dGTP diphosphatase